MASPRITAFMGRKQIRGNTAYGSSQAALNAQFQASMSEVLQGLREFISHIEGITPDVLIEALEPTFGKALERTPVKTRALRNSGYLEARSYRGGAEVEIGFGRGGSPTYSIYVHEMPFWHEPPTQDKFLQSAIDEDYFTILSSIPRLFREAAGT